MSLVIQRSNGAKAPRAAAQPFSDVDQIGYTLQELKVFLGQHEIVTFSRGHVKQSGSQPHVHKQGRLTQV